MNQRVQHKIDQYKRTAAAQNSGAVRRTTGVITHRSDSLGEVIRSKRDADTFMSELESIVKRAK